MSMNFHALCVIHVSNMHDPDSFVLFALNITLMQRHSNQGACCKLSWIEGREVYLSIVLEAFRIFRSCKVHKYHFYPYLPHHNLSQSLDHLLLPRVQVYSCGLLNKKLGLWALALAYWTVWLPLAVLYTVRNSYRAPKLGREWGRESCHSTPGALVPLLVQPKGLGQHRPNLEKKWTKSN